MNLIDQLEKTANKYPQKAMVIFKGTAYSFQEIYQHSCRLADALGKSGIRKGDAVTIGLPNSPAFILFLLALAQIGAVAVPLNPELKSKELEFIFKDSMANAAITYEKHSAIIDSLKKAGKKVPRYVFLIDHHASLSNLKIETTTGGEVYENPTQDVHPDIFLIVYTSGTTGTPKGVMLSQENMLSVARAVAKHQDRNSTDIGICFFPLTHITGIVNFIVDSLVTGATIILQECFDIEDYMESFDRYKCTTIGGVTAVFLEILRHKSMQKNGFPHLKRITSGGASLPTDMFQKLSETFKVPVIEMYGMTENAATLTSNLLQKQKIGSVGVPLPGMEVQIMDEHDKVMPVNTIGEIVAKSPGIMKGYRNRPELSQKMIRKGWYRTGDLGRIDEDGFLYVVGRKDDMINSGAFKIYPREVEELLYSHPAIADCAVKGIEDRRLGQIPVAYIVLEKGQTASAAELTGFIKKHLVNYKCPRHFYFLDELPRTSHGKIAKHLLSK